MIIPKQGLLASARLKRAVPGVRRVILARTDGIAMYDDASLVDRDTGAAMTATLLGLATSVAGVLASGAVRSAVVNTETESLVVFPIDAGHLLAVLCSPEASVGDLTIEAEAIAHQLSGRWRRVPVKV